MENGLSFGFGNMMVIGDLERVNCCDVVEESAVKYYGVSSTVLDTHCTF